MATTKVINDIIDFNQTNQTESLKGCVGTTANRPASPSNGDIRTNTSLTSAQSDSVMEFYRDTGTPASSGWFPLTNNAQPVDYVTDGLIRHFSTFDDLSNVNLNSNTWTDLTGNGNATVTGITFNSGTKIFETFSTSVINLGNVLGSGNTAQVFTIELWFKVDSTKDATYVQGAASNVVGSGGFVTYIETPNANDNMNFSKYYPSGADAARYASVGNLSTGVWHQYVHGFSAGATIYAWADGQDLTGGTFGYGSQSSATNTVNTNGANMYFGSFTGGTNYLIGEAGIIRIYNKVLSDAEVLQNFNANKADVGL